MNNVQQAKELHERALGIQMKNLEPDHVYVAFSLHNLGEVQRELGDLVKAKENFEHALNIRLKKLGPEHADVWSTHHELCNIQRALTVERDHEGKKCCVIS